MLTLVNATSILVLAIATWYLHGILYAGIAAFIWWMLFPRIYGACMTRWQREVLNYAAENPREYGFSRNWRELPKCRNCGRRVDLDLKTRMVRYCARCHPEGPGAAYFEMYGMRDKGQ